MLKIATILIVDDLTANRTFLAAVLGSQGHRTIEAADGTEALTAVRAEHPDLVITDVLMPVMDGYELVRELRRDPATRTLPVVFHTAHYGEHEARALAQSSGVSAVLTKPADSTEVLKVVSRMLSGESAAEMPPVASPLPVAFDREHLRLLTDKLSDKAADLRTANARLRAVINIGLELASERDAGRLLESVCVAARDLFAATYVTIGILDQHDRAVQRVVTCGVDAAPWITPGDVVSGILGRAVAERRTFRGDNPGGDPARLQLPARHPDVQAFLVAPIASLAHVYGWICLVGNERRSFTEDDEHLAMALSGQVGRIYELEHEIVERQRAEEEIRHRAQLSALGAAVGLALTKADSLAGALQQSAVALVTHLGAAFARFWILDEREGVLELRASAGLYTHLDGPHGRVPLGEFKIGRIARDRKPHLTNTVIGDPEVNDQDWARREGIVAFAGHPLIVDGRVVGVMALFARHVLSDAVIAALASVADHIALGIERHRSGEALRTAEERMRFALDAAGVGIWDLDYIAGVLRWSETLEAQYGLQPGTFDGTFDAFVERVHPDDRESVLNAMEKAVTSGADYTTLHRSITPDGTVRWLSGAGRIHFGAQGEAVRGVGISLDVTDRRALEEQYQQAQKMEAVGRLAGGVAHDFNNLLTVILGYCGLVLEDLDSADRRYPDITQIQKAGMRGAALTRQLLAFSRKQIIEPTLLDLNVVVADMQPMLGRLIGEDVRVVLGLRPAPAPVKADRGQVEQIVLNLAVNARDAMPKGGTLTIEIANVDLDEDYPKTHFAVHPGPYVALTVTDTGTGMTPQIQARLFEPFFTTKEVGKGTGLGLATVHSIVIRSGGSVIVESEPGRGSSFKVYFPRADAAEIAVDAPPVRPHVGVQTVLLVEDEEELRELATRLLHRQGYTVLAAANAIEARQLFERNESIDVLLTDVVMPGASGPELTRALVAERPALRVIYMSGYTDADIVQHGILNPGIAFLHKPFTAETLGRKIREVLDR